MAEGNSKVTTNEIIVLAGCALVFIGVFLKWFAVGGGSVAGFAIPEYSVNGFNYFLQGTLPWIIAIAVAAVIIVRRFVPNVNLPDNVGGQDWNMVLLIAAAVAGFLILTRLLMGDSGTNRKIGLFLAAIGGIAMAVGAFLKYQSKEEFGGAGGGGAAPPSSF